MKPEKKSDYDNDNSTMKYNSSRNGVKRTVECKIMSPTREKLQ